MMAVFICKHFLSNLPDGVPCSFAHCVEWDCKKKKKMQIFIQTLLCNWFSLLEKEAVVSLTHCLYIVLAHSTGFYIFFFCTQALFECRGRLWHSVACERCSCTGLKRFSSFIFYCWPTQAWAVWQKLPHQTRSTRRVKCGTGLLTSSPPTPALNRNAGPTALTPAPALIVAERTSTTAR